MRRRLAFVALMLLSACTPNVADRPAGCDTGRSDGCRPAMELPGPNTEIGRVAKNCSPPRYCSALGFVDCHSAEDGPAYYFERNSGKIVGRCGGICMTDPEGKCAKTCPPPEWTCRPKS
jgi:hypothetical protein